MISFESDYIEGAHPAILKKLITTNFEQLPGYGADIYTASAGAKIKDACGLSEGEIYFLTGGTQTNQIVLNSLLKPFEGVISPNTGHIDVHEAGAIEFDGHKIISLPSHNGKLEAGELADYCANFYNDPNHEHMVYPGVVFLTFPTELGTLYSKKELIEIKKVAEQYNLRTYIDGARLGYGLMAKECDLNLKDLSELVDVFYIGGTKVGAFCGEAVVFTRAELVPEHFANIIKKHGALNAKGRLLAIQFDVLFSDNLYFEIGKYADELAMKLKDGFIDRGYQLFVDSYTNQQFIILENEEAKKLSEFVRFSFWEKIDDNRTAYRFVTDWATKQESIDYLLEKMDKIL